MSKRDDVIRGLKCSVCPTMPCGNCTYFVPNENDPDTGWCDRNAIYKDALELLKEQDTTMLQGFLTDIPSSESILNSVNCHAISLEDASKIIAICAYACDVMSPSGFIRWLKDRLAQDAILKGVLENDKSRNH